MLAKQLYSLLISSKQKPFNC